MRWGMRLSAVSGLAPLLTLRRKRSQRASWISRHPLSLQAPAVCTWEDGWRHPRPVAANGRLPLFDCIGLRLAASRGICNRWLARRPSWCKLSLHIVEVSIVEVCYASIPVLAFFVGSDAALPCSRQGESADAATQTP
jgi:hypothetical protein